MKPFENISQKVVAGAVMASASLPAFANGDAALAAPDLTKIVAYISVTAVGAIVAIGGAKMIPAAALWLYTSITNMIKRS